MFRPDKSHRSVISIDPDERYTLDLRLRWGLNTTHQKKAIEDVNRTPPHQSSAFASSAAHCPCLPLKGFVCDWEA
jgi:hypothetical protein